MLVYVLAAYLTVLSAAGVALALALGMQLSGSEYMTRLLPSWSTKLRWAVHLAFLFDAEELTRGGAQARGEEPQGGTAAVPWRDSLARWSLAGLFRHLGFDRDGDGGTPRELNHACPTEIFPASVRASFVLSFSLFVGMNV